MWIVIKLLGFEILAVGIRIHADDDDGGFISHTGGDFTIAAVEEEEYDEEYDPEYDNRRPPFGFRHA